MLKRNFAVLMAVLTVLMAFCGCVQTESTELEPGEIFHNTDTVYANGLFNPSPLYMEWTIEENGLTVRDDYEEKTTEPIEWAWQEFPFSEEEWNAFFEFPEEIIDLSPYGKMLYQPINDFNFMLFADGEIWHVSLLPYGPEENPWIITGIDLLVPWNPSNKAEWEFDPENPEEQFFDFKVDTEFTRISASGGEGRLVDIDEPSFRLENNIVIDNNDFIRWSPTDRTGKITLEAEINFSINKDDDTASEHQGKIIIEGTEKENGKINYTARLISENLALKTDKKSGGGIITLR